MHQPRLRKSLADDAEFIYSVYEVTARPLVERIGKRWAERKMRDKASAEAVDGRTQIVVLGDREVGFLSVEERTTELWLHSLFLLPSYQGLGLGRQLLTERVSAARQLGVPLRCQVMSFNPAVAFYKHLGFTEYLSEEGCVFLESAS